jgi:hypothetical protein
MFKESARMVYYWIKVSILGGVFMASPTVEQVLNTVRQLSPTEFAELMELLETEQKAREEQYIQYDPLLSVIGAWADMGDEAIDAFEEEIRRSRAEPGREVVLGE